MVADLSVTHWVLIESFLWIPFPWSYYKNVSVSITLAEEDSL